VNVTPWFVCTACAHVHESSVRRLSFKCPECGAVTSQWQCSNEAAARMTAARIVQRRTDALIVQANADALAALDRALQA
jgi:predicted RNA-binding Zn-ribbon protein involved in translation (DUF1610 family)